MYKGSKGSNEEKDLPSPEREKMGGEEEFERNACHGDPKIVETTEMFVYIREIALMNAAESHQMLADETQDGRLMYTHKLAPGVTKIMLYGLRLAQCTCLPQSVLQRAKEICENLSECRLAEPLHFEEKTEAEEDQEYIEELFGLIQNKEFAIDEVKKVQNKLKQRYGVEDDPEHMDLEDIENIETQDDNNSNGRSKSHFDTNNFNPSNHTTTNYLFDCNFSRLSQTTDMCRSNSPSLSVQARNNPLINIVKSNHSGTHYETNMTPPLEPGTNVKLDDTQSLSTPQRGGLFVTTKQAGLGSCPFSARREEFSSSSLTSTPAIPARQTPSCITSTNKSGMLKMHAAQDSPESNIYQTPPKTKKIVSKNVSVLSESKITDFQVNQRALKGNSSVSNSFLNLVPYTISQSSQMHSGEALSQQSQTTNISRESCFGPSLLNSPICGETEPLVNFLIRPLDSGRSRSVIPMQQHRLPEEPSISSPISLADDGSSPSNSSYLHNDVYQYQRYASSGLVPNTTPARFGQTRQMQSTSSTPMFLNLSPNFERISMSMDNVQTGYNNDNNSFEE